jgi:hypothetical protein
MPLPFTCAVPPEYQPKPDDPLGAHIEMLTKELAWLPNSIKEEIRDELAVAWLRRKLYRDDYGLYQE